MRAGRPVLTGAAAGGLPDGSVGSQLDRYEGGQFDIPPAARAQGARPCFDGSPPTPAPRPVFRSRSPGCIPCTGVPSAAIPAACPPVPHPVFLSCARDASGAPGRGDRPGAGRRGWRHLFLGVEDVWIGEPFPGRLVVLVLARLGDEAGLVKIAGGDLRWLLEAGDASLDPRRRAIRDAVASSSLPIDGRAPDGGETPTP